MYHLVKSLYLYATSKEGMNLPRQFHSALTLHGTDLKPVEYSILLLGLDNAGKTTLLTQIRALFNTTSTSQDPAAGSTGDAPPSETAGNTVPTVGQNVATIDLPDMYIKIWDVGGQQSLRRLWNSYYKACHAVVFVVDSSDLGSGVGDDYDADETSPTPTTPSFSHVIQRDAERQGRLEECRAALESVLGHEDMVGVPILVLANKQDREDCVEVVRIKEGFVRKVFEGEKGGMVRDSRVLPVSALRGTGVKEAVEWVRSRVVWNKEGRPPVMR